jgi:hypothetical protein
MFEEFTAYDAWRLGIRFEVPFFLFQGESDVITVTSLAEEYFQEVEAPDQGAGADRGRRALRGVHPSGAVPDRAAHPGPPTGIPDQPLIHAGALTPLAAVGPRRSPGRLPAGTGDDHSDTLTSMNNLAAVRRELGELWP